MYNTTKTESEQTHIWFWPESTGYFCFVVYVYLVASFLSLELHMLHKYVYKYVLNSCNVLATVLQISFRVLAIFF